LSIPETLLSLAIVAMLLTAVATAYQAAAMSIETNDRFFQATHTARVAMNRIVRSIRTADACVVGAVSQQVNDSVSATTVDVIEPDGGHVRYAYVPGDRTITVRDLAVTGAPAYVVARNVQQALFTSQVEVGAASSARRTTCVAIDLVVQVGAEQLYLSGSAVPRRAMED
jgi:type II secretory pathway pseudopilin PulG